MLFALYRSANRPLARASSDGGTRNAPTSGVGADADTIVLGAGAAGLSAARTLCDHGLRVVVLEARDRIGGRVFTLHDPASPVPIELGAEFIHGRPEATFGIVEAAGLAACDVSGTHLDFQGESYQDERFSRAILPVLERLYDEVDEAWSFERFLRSNKVADISAKARSLTRAYVEGLYAAPADKLAALAVREAERTPGPPSPEPSFRVLAGYDRVIAWLRAGIGPERARVYLRTVAREVRWRPGSVEVKAVSKHGGRPHHFRARSLVVTLPVGVLRAKSSETGTVRFDPPLAEKRLALSHLRMGPAVRVTLRFRDRFWESLSPRSSHVPLESVSFAHSADPYFPTWWTQLPVRAPLWVGWSGGPAALRLAHLDEHALIDRALRSLAAMLETKRERLGRGLDGWYVHDWIRDPYARGAYSYLTARGLDAPDLLARPIAKTLFFAGEATEPPASSGTVGGAISSGRRAAREVLDSLRYGEGA